MALKQAEEARREAKREKDEKKMELVREKEFEKEREFLLKEQQRREMEARVAKDYNHWKDPYNDFEFQNSYFTSIMDKILLQKVSFSNHHLIISRMFQWCRSLENVRSLLQ